jgi:hypothetical protein
MSTRCRLARRRSFCGEGHPERDLESKFSIAHAAVLARIPRTMSLVWFPFDMGARICQLPISFTANLQEPDQRPWMRRVCSRVPLPRRVAAAAPSCGSVSLRPRGGARPEHAIELLEVLPHMRKMLISLLVLASEANLQRVLGTGAQNGSHPRNNPNNR